MNKNKGPIFLTNDDGFDAVGLKSLYEISKTCSTDILTVAPEKNQSGKSHSITINSLISVKKIKDNFFSVNGSPADCVILGIKELLKRNEKPKLLISGINLGANMGLDLHYSGTVAAAREGSLQGIQSVAISIQKNSRPTNWESPKFFIPRIINNLINNDFCKNSFININFPNLDINKIKGIKVTKLGKRKPGLIIEKKKIKKISYLRIPSERSQHVSARPGEDEYELNKGYITLSFHDKNNMTLNQKNPKKYELIKRKIFEK